MVNAWTISSGERQAMGSADGIWVIATTEYLFLDYKTVPTGGEGFSEVGSIWRLSELLWISRFQVENEQVMEHLVYMGWQLF